MILRYNAFIPKRRVIIMKKVKAFACVLAVAMIAGMFAGCSKTSKISTDSFAKACSKLKLEEFEVDGDAPDADDYEGGIYVVADKDAVEDHAEGINSSLKQMGLDFDADDIESLAFAAKCTGYDDAKDAIKDPEDLADVKIDGAAAFQVTFKKEKTAMKVMKAIEKYMDDANLKEKDFTANEYYSGKNEAYFRFHIDIKKFAKLILANDDIADMLETYGDQMDVDFEDLLGKLSGDVAISVEVNGANVFILVGGALNQKADTLNKFASAYGASNPAKVAMNEKICEKAIDGVTDYLAKAKSAAEQVKKHNEEVDKVNEEIDAAL